MLPIIDQVLIYPGSFRWRHVMSLRPMGRYRYDISPTYTASSLKVVSQMIPLPERSTAQMLRRLPIYVDVFLHKARAFALSRHYVP